MVFERGGKEMKDSLQQQINTFAKKQGYSSAIYTGEWRGFHCYEPSYNDDQVRLTMLPYVILVDTNNNIRMSSPEESIDHIASYETLN
jgi:hypothetical protein